MKKILFATTALVATASVAAADVTFGGFGRFGLSYSEDRGTAAGLNDRQDTQLDHRVRLVINAGAESDNGISFNAQTRIQWDDVAQGAGDTAGANDGASRGALITVEKDALKLNIGNYSLAENAGASYWGCIGYTGFVCRNPRAANGDVTTGNWAGADDTQVAVEYTGGGMSVGVATSDDALGGDRNVLTLNYDLGGYGLGLTHQASDAAAEDYTAVSVTGNVGGASLALYADDYSNGTNAFGITVGFDIAASTSVTLMANTLDDNVAGNDDASYGVGLSHDLGGGVSFGTGVASVNGLTNAEAGVVFNF